MIRYVCKSEDENVLLSSLLPGRLDIYTSTLRKLKVGGGIFLNGEPVHVRRFVHEGDVVEIDLSKAETPSQIPPEPWLPEIIYESPGMLAVNKPAMSVVHPTCFHHTGTIAAGVVNYYNKTGLNSGIHLVNRLDLGTSGLLLFAKYGLVQERMKSQAASGEYKKVYIGVIDVPNGRNDIVPGFTGTVDAPIERDRSSIIKRKVGEGGDPSVTKYTILAAYKQTGKALAAFSLLTGRTHQIRVHMSHIGLPLTGDTMYNPAYDETTEKISTEGPHQLLHHYRASFTEPLTAERVTVRCPVPKNIAGSFPEMFSEKSRTLTAEAEDQLSAGLFPAS